MVYILLLLTVFFCSYQNVLKKEYNKRCSGGIFCYSGLICLSALAVFAVANRDFDITPKLLGYAAAFSVAYAAATVCMVLAFRYGSLAISSLIISYSLLIPTIYGVIFLKEPIGVTMIVGFALLIVSLLLTNFPQKKNAELVEKEEKKKSHTLLWIIALAISFVGNGMCSTIQTMEKQAFVGVGENPQTNLFMILALAINTIVMFGISLFTERSEIKTVFKKTWWIAVICGLMNGLTNLLVIYLNPPRLPASVLFPVISGGGIVFTFLYAMIVYREKFKPIQIVGFVLGVGSIVLLNL